MKVVFDTNIFISALVVPGGSADRASRRVVEGEDTLILSQAIVEEVLDVLARKFERDAEQLARVAVFLSELGEVVRPRRRLRVLRDDADNRILECALSGAANAIVTGDRDLLDVGEYEGICLLSLRAYVSTGKPAR